ncbi:hypothetical protein ACFX15_012891 [Malus domestica]
MRAIDFSALYLIRNAFFGWNYLAPWFSYPRRKTLLGGRGSGGRGGGECLPESERPGHNLSHQSNYKGRFVPYAAQSQAHEDASSMTKKLIGANASSEETISKKEIQSKQMRWLRGFCLAVAERD